MYLSYAKHLYQPKHLSKSGILISSKNAINNFLRLIGELDPSVSLPSKNLGVMIDPLLKLDHDIKKLNKVAQYC